MTHPSETSGGRSEKAGGKDAALRPQPPLLDLAHLDAQVAGDRALRQDLLRLYAGRLVVLAADVRGPPGPRRREAAHALKGASLTVGAVRLAGICDALERGDEAARQQVASAIEATRRRVEDVLHQDV